MGSTRRCIFFGAHAVHNAVIVALTYQGVWTTLLSPIHSMDGEASALPCIVQLAFHLLHCVVECRTLTREDWAHHVLSSIAVGVLTIAYRYGPLLHYGLFFATGLPGGVNYAALVLVQRGTLSRTAQKRINRAMHGWVRLPGIMTWLAFAWTCRRAGAFNDIPLLVVVAQFVLVGGNAVYYADAVSVDWGKHCSELRHRHRRGGPLTVPVKGGID